MASIIEDHPQRAEIERAILAGQSARSISKWCQPYVSHNAINDFRKAIFKHVVPHASKAIAKQAVIEVKKQLPSVTHEQATEMTQRASLVAPFLARMEKKYGRYDKLLSDAEDGRIVLDKMGQPVKLSPDIKAIASLDAAETRTMELHARLTGALDNGQAGVQVQIAIAIPGAVPAVQAEQQLPCIDITPE